LILLAFGSALFHVAGGMQSSLLVPTSSVGSSIFNAPGVIGLALGTYAALQSISLIPAFGALFFMVLGVLWATELPATMRQSFFRRSTLAVPLSVVLGIVVLIFGVASRSMVWMSLGKEVTFHVNWILLFEGMAALGKLGGGFIADRIGMKQAMVGMTLLAALCFTQTGLPSVLIGIVLLQASTPVALAFLVQRIPRWGATMTGLILGLAIALGGFAATHLISLGFLMMSALLIFSALCFFGGATASVFPVRRNS
jgi:hypothetical protein